MKMKITSFFVYFIFLVLVWGFAPVFFGTAHAESGFETANTTVHTKDPERFSISNLPNDNYYYYQWYLERIKADKAWDRIKESSETVVAVIDTGVQTDHPDLKDNMWINEDEIPDNGIDDDGNGFIDDRAGWDFINNTPNPSPRFDEDFSEAGVSHGTIVSGIIAAETDNEEGIAGVTWGAKIMPLRVLDSKGEGGASGVIRAIDYAIKNKADIINLSFVGPVRSDAMQKAILRAHKAGVIVVAAAGNEDEEGHGFNLDEKPMYPVCYDKDYDEKMVIGVGATDTMDQKTNFSSYGDCVDIMAPGVSIFSTVAKDSNKQLNGNYFDQYYGGFWSGTSMAVPMVSGALALIEAANPDISTEKVKEILLNNTDKIDKLNPDYPDKIGSGRLNVKKSVDKALELLNSKEIKLLTSPASKKDGNIQILDYSGSKSGEFKAYDNFDKEVNITSGDLNGDGIEEIITGAGLGGGPQVRIFDNKGKFRGQFFAYDPLFRGGVNVASGDVDGDGKEEIITGAGQGGGPHVRIFDDKGNLVGQFFAYDPLFRGGVNVASGDVDGDGKEEIVTGAGAGGGPHVKIFDYSSALERQFFAYNSNFRGGVNVSVDNVDGNITRDKEEIVTAPQSNGGPHVRIFDNKANLVNQFFAYKKSFRGGVNISSGDINKDGWSEIITGAGHGGGPHVRYFNIKGEIINSYYAYDRDFVGGVNLRVLKSR